MVIQQSPATVPYEAYQREREGRIKAEREWHYWENEFYLQRKIRRAPVLQPIDKAILEECRHVEKWGTVKAPDGSTRANYTTIANNLKSSPGTVATHAERLKQLGLIDIHEHQGPKDESDRKYIHVHEEKLPHLDELTDPTKVVPQQGGDRFAYRCMKCDTEMEIRTITKSHKKVMLRCPGCQHESILEEDLEDVVEDTGWRRQNGQKAQKQHAFGDTGDEEDRPISVSAEIEVSNLNGQMKTFSLEEVDQAEEYTQSFTPDSQKQLAQHSVYTLPPDSLVSDDEAQKQVASEASAFYARYPDIPPELDGRIWICWKWGPGKDGKITKVPYLADMRGETKIDATNLGNGRTFAYALACLEASKEWEKPFDGIGFLCDGSFVGIDLDHCRNKETGEIEAWAQDIIDRFPPTCTYITPSGEGLRLIIHAKKPGPRCRTGKIEIYEKDRFFTWTPEKLPGTPLMLADGQEALEALYHELFPEPEPPQPTNQGPLRSGRDEESQEGDEQSEEEVAAILDKAMHARNGAKFALLHTGQWQEVKNKEGGQYYPSQSEADQGYCRMVRYWGGSVSTIDRLYRQSGLYRPERWDGPARAGDKTYGEGTIKRALQPDP